MPLKKKLKRKEKVIDTILQLFFINMNFFKIILSIKNGVLKSDTVIQTKLVSKMNLYILIHCN